MIQDLYTALCVYHSKSIIFCHRIFGPIYPLLSSHLLPSGNHHINISQQQRIEAESFFLRGEILGINYRCEEILNSESKVWS